MKRKRSLYENGAVALVFVYTTAIFLRYPHEAGPWWLIINLVLAATLLRPVVVIAHEAGHALAAVLSRFDVNAVVIGIGRPWIETHIGRTRVTICTRCTMGYTLVAAPPETRYAAARALMTIAGGPLFNLLAFLLVGWVSGAPGWGIDSPRWTSQFAPVEIWQWANLFTAITALVPARVTTPVGVQQTDGLSLWQGLRDPQELFGKFVDVYHLNRAHERMRVGDLDGAESIYREGLVSRPENALFRHDLAVIRLQRGDYAGARADFRALLESGDAVLEPALALIKNNIAYADAMLGDPALLEEAEALSSENLAAAPNVAHFQGTRGAVLLQQGRVEEGRKHLANAYRQHSDPPARASAAAWLARACLRGHDPDGVEKWLAMAREAWPESPEIAAVERERESTPPPPARISWTRPDRARSV